MRWFRVLIEGEHVMMDVASERRYMGFFVTRFVNAETPALASALAMSAVRTDPKLDRLILNNDDDPPVFSVDEIDEVAEVDVLKGDPGFVFFRDEEQFSKDEVNPPPYLVIRKGVAFWVENRPLSDWTATSQAFNDGCFLNSCLYDTRGERWQIVHAEFSKQPSYMNTLLPWRNLPVRIEIRLSPKPALADILVELTAILQSENSFSMNLNHEPTDVLERLRSIATPAELIQYAQKLI